MAALPQPSPRLAALLLGGAVLVGGPSLADSAPVDATPPATRGPLESGKGELGSDKPSVGSQDAPPKKDPELESLFQPGPRSPRVLALGRGLEFLAKQQLTTGDGSFPRGDGEGLEFAPVAITALGSLALMAGGSSPTQGPHHKAVARAIDYLLLHTDLSPASATRGFISAGGDETSLMHGHGFATLALAEAYGMSPRGERIKTALVAAVDLIERTQGAQGGWFYKPERQSEHEGSLTVCLVQALRAAREAGIKVDKEVIVRADGYLERSQAEDGSYAYQIGSPRTSVALTAAAISSLNATGKYTGKAIAGGIDAIWRDLAEREAEGGRSRFPFYERLYLAQAFWQHQDETHFERWYAPEVKTMLRSQDQDGSWFDGRFGSSYATAMICLVLAMPDSLLPAFQR
ncbi:MAG: hypothetical protein P1V81_11800 [Planctomycetota bacterium]|nr:hypothetical protein [Planctomycetota bacterium]